MKLKLNISDTFNKELPADPNKNNTRRQVKEACFSYVTPRKPSNPSVIHTSAEMLSALGMSKEDAQSEHFKNVFTGAKVLDGTQPYAMCYGGHQFGHWAGQLGDGRAINLGEVKHNEKRWALQLKGSGATPYSRTADGLAVLRSSVREHLCSEAMYHLGVPTTRSLSLSLTGDEVMRDVMYDGNPAYEKGAVVCRTAPSFIRFGSFQILGARKDVVNLQKLTDYTIRHFFPNIKETGKKAYIQFFREVAERTLDMILHWQRIGFVHGVMNTDNMSILGLTIDYGPYGWLEGYDPSWTPNTTDAQGKRYRFGNQANMALWNLIQLANVLLLLIEETEPLEATLHYFQNEYPNKNRKMMLSKLGLQSDTEETATLINNLRGILQANETDMTIFYRNLANISKDESKPSEHLKKISAAFYQPHEIEDQTKMRWHNWLSKYTELLQNETVSDEARKEQMNQVNPKYVLRNYMSQLAIDKADKGDYTLINELHEVLKKPYAEQPEYEQWFSLRPEWARHKVGCSMLSCSS
jgi:uncharacterized protein YdiU (UPF0061 family)